MTLRLRLGLEWSVITLLASLAVLAMIHWDATQKFDNLLYDQLGRFDRPDVPDDIIIVAIDDHSLADFGKWPWPRVRHAELFQQLEQTNIRAVGLDVLLSEHGEPAGDEALAAGIASQGKTFLPLHFVVPGSNGSAHDVVPPIASLADAAAGVGHVNLQFDDDGKVRRTSLCFRSDVAKQTWPHLMELVYRQAYGKKSAAFERQVDCDERLLMPYSAAGAFPMIPFSSVAKGEVPADFFDGKIVLIGATATGLGDQYPTPLGEEGTQAGIVIMANMLGAMARDDFVAPIGFGPTAMLSLLPLWFLLFGFLRWKPRNALLVSMGMIALILAIGALLLSRQIWFAPGAALAGLALVYPIWGWRRLQATSDYMGAELQRLQISQDLSPVPVKPAGAVDLVTGQAEALNQAIMQLRDLRRFISDALSNMPDPMLITDVEGKITFINKLADQGLGTVDDDLDLNQALEKLVSPEYLPKVREYIAGADGASTLIESGPDIISGDPRYVRFIANDDMVFAMRRAPILSGEGELRGHVHYLADITALANASKEREEVLQLLSHDMRAPQSAILALIGRKDGWAKSDQMLKSRIEMQARRTLRLADDFVDLARMKEAHFEPEALLLADLVEEACDQLWPLASARHVRFEVDDQSDAGFIMGEPASLSRALINLLDNAVKYSPKKSVVSISVTREDDVQGQALQLEVADQGEGIDADMLDTLFEKFVSSQDSNTSAVAGVGLGLNFVQAVTHRHGGTIKVKNSEQGGAIFCLRFPLAEEVQ